jgi:hypothetical protein
MNDLIIMSDLSEVKSQRQGKHMTCTDKQSPRSRSLPRRISTLSALIPCLPLTFCKPEWVVTRPLQSMATTEGPARVHGECWYCPAVEPTANTQKQTAMPDVAHSQLG